MCIKIKLRKEGELTIYQDLSPLFKEQRADRAFIICPRANLARGLTAEVAGVSSCKPWGEFKGFIINIYGL